MNELTTDKAIMLSSTFADMKEHRRIVLDAIVRFGYLPINVTPASLSNPEGTIRVSLNQVHAALAYIGIVGFRYGFVPHGPKLNLDRLSIGELEFNEAARFGRPIVFFVMDDEHLVSPADVESDSEKQEKLVRFRERLRLAYEPGEIQIDYHSFKSLEEFSDRVRLAIGKLVLDLRRSALPKDPLDRLASLTARERQVFGKIVRGKLNRQIARELATTERTAKALRHRVMEKMNARSVAELVSIAQQSEIVQQIKTEGSTPDNHELSRGPVSKSVADYFLSYSTVDESIARSVAGILEGAGYSVFAQYKDIPIGSNFVEEMKQGLASKRIVALLSPAYEASAHCRAEWNAGYADDADGSKRKLVPLLVQSTDLNFLARQVVYANLVGLTGKAFEERVLEAVRVPTIATAPIKNVASPIRHEWTADAKLRVLGSAFPLPGLGRGSGDLLKQLSTARKLAERLADQSSSTQFNHARQYAIQLKAYLEDLPTSEADGNIYLADASARTLREMFAAEADYLSVSFTAPLKTFLECHVGMRAYYPELSDFYASVRDGVLVAPLSLDAVERVRSVINEHTPDTFDRSVAKELAKEEASAPQIAGEGGASASDSSLPQPPPDPIGELDRAQSRDQLIARSLNGLWSTFLKGKDIVPNIEGWRRAYEALEPTIRPVLNYLRQSLGG